MNRICVFCGSSPGQKPDYLRMAKQLGDVLVKRHIGLVYGGGDVGLMGKLVHVVNIGRLCWSAKTPKDC